MERLEYRRSSWIPAPEKLKWMAEKHRVPVSKRSPFLENVTVSGVAWIATSKIPLGHCG